MKKLLTILLAALLIVTPATKAQASFFGDFFDGVFTILTLPLKPIFNHKHNKGFFLKHNPFKKKDWKRYQAKRQQVVIIEEPKEIFPIRKILNGKPMTEWVYPSPSLLPITIGFSFPEITYKPSPTHVETVLVEVEEKPIFNTQTIRKILTPPTASTPAIPSTLKELEELMETLDEANTTNTTIPLPIPTPTPTPVVATATPEPKKKKEPEPVEKPKRDIGKAFKDFFLLVGIITWFSVCAAIAQVR